MTVRAKFRVNNTKSTHYDNNYKQHDVEMQAVCSSKDNEENTKFFQETPIGHISIGVLKEEVADFFEPGKEYYIDFTKVEEI